MQYIEVLKLSQLPAIPEGTTVFDLNGDKWFVQRAEPEENWECVWLTLKHHLSEFCRVFLIKEGDEGRAVFINTEKSWAGFSVLSPKSVNAILSRTATLQYHRGVRVHTI